MAFKLGSVLHAKGYILNKLFEDQRIGGKHLPVDLLKNGYPPQYRPLIDEAFQELKTENPPLILVQNKRTGRDTSQHVCLVPGRLAKARALINGYRKAVGLPTYLPGMTNTFPAKQTSKK